MQFVSIRLMDKMILFLYSLKNHPHINANIFDTYLLRSSYSSNSLGEVFAALDLGRGKVSWITSYEKLTFHHFSC